MEAKTMEDAKYKMNTLVRNIDAYTNVLCKNILERKEDFYYCVGDEAVAVAKNLITLLSKK